MEVRFSGLKTERRQGVQVIKTYRNAVSLAVNVASLAGLDAGNLRGLSRAERDGRGRGLGSARAGLGGSQSGEEAGQNNGETHGDGL